ncbi:hypothetical protein E3P96_02399 [Wallemia ichthyophaga]|nr:hypothetical protein E3P96_02399 [Wallemia ichthyophaga]
MTWPRDTAIEINEEGLNIFDYPSEPGSFEGIKVSTEEDKVRVEEGGLSYIGHTKGEKDYNYCLEYDDDSGIVRIIPIKHEYTLQQLENVDDFLDKELLDGFQDISDEDDDPPQSSIPVTANTSSNTQPMSLNDYLGRQGFMSWKPPTYIRSAITKAIDSDTSVHHYSHPKGRPRLRNALSNHFSKQFKSLNGRKLDVESEIIVTAGANEAIYSILGAFLEQDDEVILFEPAFDQYMPNVRYNGGKEVYVPIRFHGDPTRNSTGDDWKIDINELIGAITPKTKAIIFNTPHNPIGKVFTREELQAIANVAIEHNLLVISDEVYESLTFDNATHDRIADVPGMWERTLTVGSAGKTFAATGWRVGWVIGHPDLVKATLATTMRIVFCVNSLAQEGTAVGFEEADQNNFFETQRKEYQERRDVLTKHLDQIGLPYTKPAGSYFILADISKVNFPEDYPFPENIKTRTRDFRFAWWMAHEFGVVAIPPSDFYGLSNQHLGEQFIRFAFCKEADILDEAGSGSYGIVRLSTHRLIKGARVAVKSVSKNHTQLSALVRELHHYRRLSHPHIAQLLEIVATENDIHLVTELCDGGELFDYLVDKGRLSDVEVRRVFGQLMLALHYLHSNGVVHRDLKLENILLDKDGNVKLGDFGFAREFDDGPGNLMSTWCGTTAYASPEMLRGEKYGGKQTDIWSSGVILYALLTGGLPFDDDDEDEMRELVLKGEYYHPTDVLSADACDLISAILQPLPQNRPSIEQILAHPFFTRFPSQQTPLHTLHDKLEHTAEHASYAYDEKHVSEISEGESEATEVFEGVSDVNHLDEPPRRLVPATTSSGMTRNLSVESIPGIALPRRSGGSFKRGMVRTLSSEREGASTPPIQRTPSRTKRRSVSSTMSDLPVLTPVASRIPSTTSLREHYKVGSMESVNFNPNPNFNLGQSNADDLHHFHPQEPNYLEMCTAQHAQPFEEEWERALLQSLSQLGFDIGQIKHSVINHACDASGGLWWLLRKQNLDTREHLTRIEEEGAGLGERGERGERRDSEEYLMINTRKQKEEREKRREKERDKVEKEKAEKEREEKDRREKEKDRDIERDKQKLKMSDQRADFSKRSLPDLNESGLSLTPPTEASTSSLQLNLPQTSAPSSPNKTKSRSSSISMLQRATTALSGSMLPRKKSDERSGSNDDSVSVSLSVSGSGSGSVSTTPPISHAAQFNSTASLNQLPTDSPRAASEHDLHNTPNIQNSPVTKEKDKKNLLDAFRGWFTDDKRERKKGKTTPKKQKQKQTQGQLKGAETAAAAESEGVPSTVQMRRSASHNSNSNTLTPRRRNARTKQGLTRGQTQSKARRNRRNRRKSSNGRRASSSSTQSMLSPQTVAMAVPQTQSQPHSQPHSQSHSLTHSRRSSSVHSRRSSISVHFESGSPSAAMNRRVSSGGVVGRGQHAKSPSMSSVSSARSVSGRMSMGMGINPSSNTSFGRAGRHRSGSSSSLQRVRHVRAPSSSLPTSRHSRSTSTSSLENGEKVVGLGLRDSEVDGYGEGDGDAKVHTRSSHTNHLPHSSTNQQHSKTLFLASKRPPAPISVHSPPMKSFALLKASKFDYSRTSPTKNLTFDTAAGGHAQSKSKSNALAHARSRTHPHTHTYTHSHIHTHSHKEEEWVDEDDFAGGIGQGDASALIGEFESSVAEEHVSVTEHSDEDEIEGVKKLKKSKKTNNRKNGDARETMSDFKFPRSGGDGNGTGTGSSHTTNSNSNSNATSTSPTPPNTSNHQKWRPSVATAAVIEEDEEDD